MLQWTWVCKYIFKVYFQFSVYPEARLLNHDNSIFNFLRNFHAVFHCSCTHFTFLPAVLKGFLFLHVLATLNFFLCFDSGHPNGYEMISCGFDFHPPMISDVEHLFMYSLDVSMPSLETCLFKSFASFFKEKFHFLFHSFSLLWLFSLLCRSFCVWCSPICLCLLCFACGFGVIDKKSLPYPVSWSFPPIFSFKSFITSGLNI